MAHDSPSRPSGRPSRRQFLKVSLAGAAVAALLPACKGGGAPSLSCVDTAGLAPADLQMRTTLGYVDASIDAAKNCANCLQYVPAAPRTCGGCKVVKGPINPAGNCKAWAAKPPA